MTPRKTISMEGKTKTAHPVSGTLFRITYPESETGRADIEYECIDYNAEILWEISRGIKGEDVSEFHYALVRRNTPAGWRYYPLPLIYASEDERVLAAAQMGNKAPPERWVKRRQQAVELLLKETFAT